MIQDSDKNADKEHSKNIKGTYMGVATRIFVSSISQVHLSGLPRLIHGRCWGDFPQLASSVGGRCVMSALMRLFNDNSTALCQVPHHGTTIKEKDDAGNYHTFSHSFSFWQSW